VIKIERGKKRESVSLGKKKSRKFLVVAGFSKSKSTSTHHVFSRIIIIIILREVKEAGLFRVFPNRFFQSHTLRRCPERNVLLLPPLLPEG